MSPTAQEALEQARLNLGLELKGPSPPTDYVKIPEDVFEAAQASSNKDLLRQLEQKRKQVDDKIALYIEDVQKSYDDFARALFERESATSKSQTTASPDNVKTSDTTYRSSNPSSVNKKEQEDKTAAPTVSERPREADRSPVDDREMELAGFFTPHFLPLLEARPVARSSSYPSVATEAKFEQHEVAPHLERAASVPVTHDYPIRKSALRKEKRSSRRKRVSLSIDSGIVRPADEPQYESTPATPTDDDEGSAAPNLALIDKDGSTVYVWVPEKARLPLPGEDPVDYVIAVGGILHDSNELQEDSMIIDPLPSTSDTNTEDFKQLSLDRSSDAIRTEDKAILEDEKSFDQKRAVETEFSPPTSPSLAIRQHPTYTDSFSTSSNRIQSPVQEVPPKIEHTGLGFQEQGPSSSYVGGIGGSGVDAMDTGSIGYPSSLGASYMEQFAAARHFGNRSTSNTLESSQEFERPTTKPKGGSQQTVQADDDEFLGEMEGI